MLAKFAKVKQWNRELFIWVRMSRFYCASAQQICAECNLHSCYLFMLLCLTSMP